MPFEAGVRIRAGSRIQLGFFPYMGGFVGMGVALATPSVDLAIYPSPGKIPRTLDAVVRRCVQAGLVGQVHVEVSRLLPAHVGLGSGTATGLAVAEAMGVSQGWDRPLDHWFQIARPGARTAVGRWLYELGGAVWSEPGQVERQRWPSTWGLLLACPRRAPFANRIWGIREVQAVASIARGVSPERAGQWRHHFYQGWQRGLAVGDLSAWLEPFWEVQAEMSDVYRRLTDVPGIEPASARVLDWWWQVLGWRGTQSSWGPMVYTINALDDIRWGAQWTQEHFGDEMVVRVVEVADQGRYLRRLGGDPQTRSRERSDRETQKSASRVTGGSGSGL